MPWTAVPTHSVGDLLSSSDWNTVANNLNNPSAVRVHMASAASIPNAASTVILFDTKDEDTDTGWGGVGTGIYTVATAGLWVFTSAVGWANLTVGYRGCQVITSSGGQPGGSPFNWTANANAAGNFIASSSVVARLAVGATVKTQGYQNSGGNLNTSTGIDTCFMTGVRVAS